MSPIERRRRRRPHASALANGRGLWASHLVDDETVAHADDASASLTDSVVVRDQDKCQFCTLIEIANQVHDLAGRCRVERTGRFVSPNDSRVVDQSPGDRDALPLTTRELCGSVARPLFEIDCSQRSQRFLVRNFSV